MRKYDAYFTLVDSPNPDTTANIAMSRWNNQGILQGALASYISLLSPVLLNAGPTAKPAITIENSQIKIPPATYVTPIHVFSSVDSALATPTAEGEFMVLALFKYTWLEKRNEEFQSVEGITIPTESMVLAPTTDFQYVLVNLTDRTTPPCLSPNKLKLLISSDPATGTYPDLTLMDNKNGKVAGWTTWVDTNGYEVTHGLQLGFPIAYLKATESTETPGTYTFSFEDESTNLPGAKPIVGGGGVSSWDDLENKPSAYTPSKHTHRFTDTLTIVIPAESSSAEVTSLTDYTGINTTYMNVHVVANKSERQNFLRKGLSIEKDLTDGVLKFKASVTYPVTEALTINLVVDVEHQTDLPTT